MNDEGEKPILDRSSFFIAYLYRRFDVGKVLKNF